MQINFLDPNPSQLSDEFPESMVLVDCETTGGNATRHRIIEIGLVVVERGSIIDRWQSLVDPESNLSSNISSLTGITPEMLQGAPKFADIAKKLMNLLEGRTLVAHNARFDSGFLKNEFERIGHRFVAKTLCSVRISRLLYPQFSRHGLTQIINRFQLTVEKRHRALDDAMAIYHFFLKSSVLFDNGEISAACESILKKPSLPALLDIGEIDKLPKSSGVYYFRDAADTLLYVGKSVNIRNRVMSHFTQDFRNAKDHRINLRMASIDFERTNSDFSAQLLESEHIKSMNPIFNRRLKRTKHLFQFKIVGTPSGYHSVSIEKISEQTGASAFGLFRSSRQAKKILEKLANEYYLCHKFLGLETSQNNRDERPCFRAQLRRCFGACQNSEAVSIYNDRLRQALANYQVKVWPWPSAIVIEEGASCDGDSSQFHLVDNWRYLAKPTSMLELREFGYAPATSTIDADAPCRRLEGKPLDIDTYHILVKFLFDPTRMRLNKLRVWPVISVSQVDLADE